MELYHPLRAPSQAPREAPVQAVLDGLEAVLGRARVYGGQSGWRAKARDVAGDGRKEPEPAPDDTLEIPTRFLRATNGSTIDRLGRRR